MMRRKYPYVVIALVSALSSSVQADVSVTDDFFGINDVVEKEENLAKFASNLPIFPIVGKSSAPIKIDYFYSASCEPCRASSDALWKAVSEGLAQVSYHPIPATQYDFDRAVSETVLYTASPSAFAVFHIAMMDEDNIIEEDVFKVTSEIASISGVKDTVSKRLENYESWTRNLQVSREIAQSVGVTSLPTMIIGDRKYEGFVSETVFMETLQNMIDEPYN
jgi:protein-disulfide isomerase